MFPFSFPFRQYPGKIAPYGVFLTGIVSVERISAYSGNGSKFPYIDICIHLLFDCSTRDGDLAKVQNYFDDKGMDVDEKQADEFQQILKDTIPQFKEAGVSLFIWDGVAWYDDPRNMTAHTIIATPAVWLPFEEQQKSVAEWMQQRGNQKTMDWSLLKRNIEGKCIIWAA